MKQLLILSFLLLTSCSEPNDIDVSLQPRTHFVTKVPIPEQQEQQIQPEIHTPKYIHKEPLEQSTENSTVSENIEIQIDEDSETIDI